MKKIIFLLTIIVFAIGCSSSVRMERATPWINNIVSDPLSDVEPDKIPVKKADLTFPLTLAVIRLEKDTQYSSRNPIVGEISVWKRLGGSAEIDKVIALPSIVPSGNSKGVLEYARKMGMQAQADVVFLYQVGNDSSTYFTPLVCLLDLTLIGTIIFPGSTVDSLSIAQGILIDVKTGAILASADGSERKSVLSVTALSGKNKDSLNGETRQKVVEKIANDVEISLKQEAKNKGKTNKP